MFRLKEIKKNPGDGFLLLENLDLSFKKIDASDLKRISIINCRSKSEIIINGMESGGVVEVKGLSLGFPSMLTFESCNMHSLYIEGLKCEKSHSLVNVPDVPAKVYFDLVKLDYFHINAPVDIVISDSFIYKRLIYDASSDIKTDFLYIKLK